MKIYINNNPVEVSGELPLIEELRRIGIDIPSLCYDNKAKHHPSCMVCMVKDVNTNNMIPSCSVFPKEGMRIETNSEEVLRLRRMALELLLSDHRADCQAPCTLVCPHGLDPAKIILNIDKGIRQEIGSIPCNDCNAPCEKACRRKAVDNAVSIKDIITTNCSQAKKGAEGNEQNQPVKDVVSKLGSFTEEEKEWLKTEYTQPSRCLHCACEGLDKCKLREYSMQAGIKSSRYDVSSSLPVKQKQHVTSHLIFEPAKCIRCGLCVYNTDDGFTFHGRGFNMKVVIPEESCTHIKDTIANICPTGALYLSTDEKSEK